MKKTINSYDDLKQFEGKVIGQSPYFTVERKFVTDFTKATYMSAEDDYVPELLLLSLTPHLWNKIVEIGNAKMIINNGLSQSRFHNKVKVGEDIRLEIRLNSVSNRMGITKAEIGFNIEAREKKQTCMEGNAVFLYFFNEH